MLLQLLPAACKRYFLLGVIISRCPYGYGWQPEAAANRRPSALSDCQSATLSRRDPITFAAHPITHLATLYSLAASRPSFFTFASRRSSRVSPRASRATPLASYFSPQHFIKDLGIALSEAKRMGIALPGLALANQLYMSVAALGHGREGTQALMLALETMNGIDSKAVPAVLPAAAPAAAAAGAAAAPAAGGAGASK